MSGRTIAWDRLTDPFPAEDIEWRVSRCGERPDGDLWARVLAYITARAAQERLDEVFGPAGWRMEYRAGPAGGVLCRLWFLGDDGEWGWREDGAENTDIEPVKGGISGAFKRTGATLGIGRYLYHLEETWAGECYRDTRAGRFRARTKNGTDFSWDPPGLPAWALPGGSGKPPAPTGQVDRRTGEVREEAPAAAQRPTSSPARQAAERQVHECPKCRGPVWDNRSDKNTPKSPDWKCKDKECGWALWVETARKEIKEWADRLAVAGAIRPASVPTLLDGIADGDLDAIARAQDWLTGKQAGEGEEAA